MMPRESWTDQRLDDFKGYVSERFDRVEEDLHDGFARTDADIRELRQAIQQLHSTMVIGFIGLAGLIASSAIFF